MTHTEGGPVFRFKVFSAVVCSAIAAGALAGGGVGARALGEVAPPAPPGAGVQLWNSSTMIRSSPLDCVGQATKPEPLSIIGCGNGSFTAKVVISSQGPLSGVKGKVSDLKHTGGKGAIPPAAVKVLYSVRDDRMCGRYVVPPGGFWDTLVEDAPGEVHPVKVRDGRVGAAIQPILLKVSVPAEASPGDYQGTLRVETAGDGPMELPLHLRVFDWRLPAPREFETHMGLIQSPESVALQYKVPLWSEQHWTLMEKSFRLLAEVGNNYVCIPLICRTNFGNSESMVRWVKQPDGGYRQDFTVFDRYLDLAQKHLKLDVVCLYVWDLYCGRLHWGDEKKREGGTGPGVTVFDPATGRTEELEGPKFESPQARAFWEPVCREVRGRLEKRGLLTAMMAGISAENRCPTKEAVALFNDLLPGVKWVWNGHPGTWPPFRGQVHGMPVGYETVVYVKPFPEASAENAEPRFAWQNPWKRAVFPRGGCSAPLYHTSHLAIHRAAVEMTLMVSSYTARFNGLGRAGADFWPVMEPPRQRTTGKRSETINGRYPESCWNQLNMNTATEALLAPGPQGAVTTERFENIREGLQECAARIFIERALAGAPDRNESRIGVPDKAQRDMLGEDLAKRCRDVLDERVAAMRSACGAKGWDWYAGPGSTGLTEKLFSAAAEVAARIGAK